jgi:hypothetical protein
MPGQPACAETEALLRSLEKTRDMTVVFVGQLKGDREYLIVANDRRFVIVIKNADGSACIRGDGLAPTYPAPRV